MASSTDQAHSITLSQKAEHLLVVLPERLDYVTTAAEWSKVTTALSRVKTPVVLDASTLAYYDGSGQALLVEMARILEQRKIAFTPRGLRPEWQKRLEQNLRTLEHSTSAPVPSAGAVERMGQAASLLWADLKAQIEFLGKLVCTLLEIAVRPALLRWRDFWVTAEKAGVDALPIVGLIGFLMGLIMAFQSAMGLRQFGVDVFVINIVALATTRELGPIMTAVVLAGRSGSAFAAEIGTMKVNEELNALTTMGIDHTRFLVAPRALAAMVVTPILTVYANILGIVGGFAVMMALGFPFAALWQQMLSAISWQDFVAGLIKAVIFGLVVAGIGCLRGLQTGSGATAVGDSTTRAVVSGIVLIVAIDAVFAVLFYAIKF